MIKKLIAAGILAIAMFMPSISKAGETMVFDNDGNTVTITQDACTDKTVLSHLTPKVLEDTQWFAGTIFWQGKDVPLCYTVVMNQGTLYALVIDAEGDNGMLPLDVFKKPGTFDIEKSI